MVPASLAAGTISQEDLPFSKIMGLETFWEVLWEYAHDCDHMIHKAVQLSSASCSSSCIGSISLSSLLHSPLCFLIPFCISSLYRIAHHRTLFFHSLPCLTCFVDVYLSCLTPFPLDFVEALRKWAHLYQFLWFLLQRTVCPQVQPDLCRRLFKLPKSLRFAHLVSSQCAVVVCKMPW